MSKLTYTFEFQLDSNNIIHVYKLVEMKRMNIFCASREEAMKKMQQLSQTFKSLIERSES